MFSLGRSFAAGCVVMVWVLSGCGDTDSTLFDSNEPIAGSGGESDDGGAGPGSGGADESGGSPTGGVTATGGLTGVAGFMPATGGAGGGGGTPPIGGKGFGGAPPPPNFGGAGGFGPTTGGVPPIGGAVGTGGTTAPSCSDPDEGRTNEQGTTTGVNGAFTDACEGGELVEYFCEMEIVFDANCGFLEQSGSADAPAEPPGGSGAALPVPRCERPTGQVVSSIISCGGRCEDGVCFGWCPTLEDEVTYVEVEGDTVLLENARNEQRYQCQVLFERDGFDCTAPELTGEIFPVFATGTCNAGTVKFAINTPAEPNQTACNFDCTLVD
jgi:hypothetical protein